MVSDEERIYEFIKKNQGQSVPSISSKLQISKEKIWEIVTEFLKEQRLQTIYLHDAFHFYLSPLTICPYCGTMFATAPEVEEHIIDHLAETMIENDSKNK